MMMDLEESRLKQQLIQQLLHLCEGKASIREEESLLRSCLNLVSKYLHILERRGRRVRETKRMVEYDLLASDCLAELFQRDSSGGYPKLQNYFMPRIQALQPAEELYGALMRLLIGETRHQLARIFRQRDPEGAKVWRTTLRAAKKQGDLEVLKDVDGYYLIQRTDEPVAYCRVGAERIRTALAHILLQHLPLDQTLGQLFLNLTRQSGRPVCISLAEIVRVIRSHRQTAETIEASSQQEAGTDWAAYSQMIQQTLQHIRDILIQKYIESKKLSLEEGLALYAALSAWSQSLFDEPGQCSRKELVEANWPAGLPMADLRKILTIFDYLVRIFRQEMKNKIAQNF